jgi:hypothetical protein
MGFGSGGYEHLVAFDPMEIRTKEIRRSPKRLGKEDWEAVHQSRLKRLRGHGAINVLSSEFTRASMSESKNGFGLGFYDSSDGSLSHHFWIGTNNVERGPYIIHWMAYQSYGQFLELLSLLATFGDQIVLIRMHEPPMIQMQDFFTHPLKDRFVSSRSKFESGIHSLSYWQIRICDLFTCLDRTHLSCEGMHFNLIIDDPIDKFLDHHSWKGLSGEYIVHLGSTCSCEKGHDPNLLLLRSSIGAFCRMWLGVRPASGLSVTDQLSGPPDLLHQLDEAFRLPDPKPDWII